MKHKKSIGTRLIRLKFAIPVFFAIFLLINGSAIFFVNYLFSMRTLEKVAFNYLEQTGSIVMERTINHLEPAVKMAKLNASILNPDQFPGEFYNPFNLLTIPQFENYPQFALVYFGSTEGNFWMNGRDPNGSISTQVIKRVKDDNDSDRYLQDLNSRKADLSPEEIQEALQEYLETIVVYRSPDGRTLREEAVPDYIYDPRWRPWYKNARESGTTGWTSVYRFSSSGRYYASGKTGVTVSSPVIDSSGKLVGVVGIDIFLEELTNFLNQLKITASGRAFIVTQEGTLIAYRTPLNQDAGEDRIFSSIEDIPDTAAKTSYNLYQEIRKGPSETEQFRFETPQGRFMAFFSPIPENNGPPWLICIIAPENDFIGPLLSKLRIALYIGIGVMIMMVVLSIIIGNLITKPITMLMEDTLLIKDLNLEDSPQVPSAFREIADMSSAFQNMKVGLRSFKKYIPGDVVSHLISTGNEAVLGGVSKDLTIFFSDVADFTTISEQLSPGDLVNHLGDYLGEYSRIIQESEGTVDKYIGDAVMAFWNAPGNLKDHAVKACGAALECVKRLKELQITWKEENLPTLNTRIGIHTGEVVVGNMGSSERLNYTIIGDAVNLASRLEGLAKIYGVPILVSETTKLEADREFAFRKLDRVIVKGKTVPVTIYELLNKKAYVSEAESLWLNYFETALEDYFLQKWNHAAAGFKKALEMNKKDKATWLYLKRIGAFKTTAPSENWDGVARFQKKR